MRGLDPHTVDAEVARQTGRTWAELRADGYLPTNVYRTPAEQLQQTRDLLATWSQSLSADANMVRALARALGVRPYGQARPRVRPDRLPTPEEVPCEHGHADGVCTICADVPLLPITEEENHEHDH